MNFKVRQSSVSDEDQPVEVWLEDDGDGWLDLEYRYDGQQHTVLSVGGRSGGLVRHKLPTNSPFSLDAIGYINLGQGDA